MMLQMQRQMCDGVFLEGLYELTSAYYSPLLLIPTVYDLIIKDILGKSRGLKIFFKKILELYYYISPFLYHPTKKSTFKGGFLKS